MVYKHPKNNKVGLPFLRKGPFFEDLPIDLPKKFENILGVLLQDKFRVKKILFRKCLFLSQTP